MRFIRLVFTFLFVLKVFFSFGQRDQCYIRLDGCFDDWYSHEQVVREEQDNNTPFCAISISNDTKRLYLLVEFKEEQLLNELNNYYLEIDADNNPLTGYRLGPVGAELGWSFGGRMGYYNINSEAAVIGYNNINYFALPNYQSKTFELSIDLDCKPDGNRRLFESDTIRVLLYNGQKESPQFFPSGQMPLKYRISQRQNVFKNQTIDKSNGSDFRLLSWNTYHSAIMDPRRSQNAFNLLLTLNPDVITFNECWNTDPLAVQDSLNRIWKRAGQEVSWACVKNDMGTLTASKFRILYSFSLIAGHQVTVSVLEFQKQCKPERFTVINCHFTCCANNMQRTLEVEAIRDFVNYPQKYLPDTLLSAIKRIVMAGDLNLVGLSSHYNTLTKELYLRPKFAGLCDLMPSHLDAPLCYTWTDKLKPFSPSRLDYILYTAETIGSLKSFVYNIPGFFIDDFNSVSFTANRDRSVSDHFPVVSDFIIYSSSKQIKLPCNTCNQ